MVRMVVYVLMKHIGMVIGVNLMVVWVDSIGMDQVVFVSKVNIIMVHYV